MYIPKIEADEFDRVISQLVDMLVCAIFDATSRVGEALNIILRFCTFDFRIVQLLVAFVTLQKHMNNIQLSSLMTQLFLTKLQLAIKSVVCFDRDSASVNGAAVRRLRTTFTGASDILCICHTLCHLGEHFDLSYLEEFVSIWVHMIYSNPGVKLLWEELMGERAVGFSPIRWYCKAEIVMQNARHFNRIEAFLDTLDEKDFCPTLRVKLREKYDWNPQVLKLQHAAVLDMKSVVSTTYKLEGDGALMPVAFQLIESVRITGRSLASDGTLPNVEAVLRDSAELRRGLIIKKVFAGYGNCEGKVIEIGRAESTLYPGKTRTVYTVQYEVDGTKDDLEEEEIRPLISTGDSELRKSIVEGLSKGFTYLEDRLTGNCAPNFDCRETYELFRLSQVIDPTFAAAHLTPGMVVDLMAIPAFAAHNLLDGLKFELPAYLAAAATCPPLDRGDLSEYTTGVLSWWRNNNCSFPTWAIAARIIFAMAPSSAASERVFSLVKQMFGTDQLSALADYVQGSLMLRHNKRAVG